MVCYNSFTLCSLTKKKEDSLMKSILLHGLGQTSSEWDKTVEVMENRMDIICPNLSEWLVDKKPCYNTLYQMLENYCNQFNEPLNLCGLSLGGILAMQYGIEHADRVNSLVLIGTQYTMPKRLLRFQNMLFHIMPKSVFSKMGFQKKDFISICNSIMELDFQQSLSDIQCPVLLLCGSKDNANKTASVDMEKMIPCAKLSIIQNAGHEVNKDNPVELGKQLNTFFNLK